LTGTYLKVLVSHKSLSGKGVNDLIFVARNGETTIYRIDMPDDAPFKVSGNQLYFALPGKDQSVLC